MMVLHRICCDIEIRTEENAYRYIPLTRLQQNAEPYYKAEKNVNTYLGITCDFDPNHMSFTPKSHVIVIIDDNS